MQFTSAKCECFEFETLEFQFVVFVTFKTLI